jgi:hypothetical protein
MKAFMMAVVKRSNSRNCGDADAEVATNTSGSIQTGQSQGMLVVMVLG